MPTLWLPISAAQQNPKTEKQAIMLRLRQLGYLVPGWEQLEVQHLRDILAKAEHQAEQTQPQRLDLSSQERDVAAGILKERLAWNKRRKG